MGSLTFIANADNVMPFSTEGRENVFRSQVLIGPDGANSTNLYITRFTLLAGQKLSGSTHPAGTSDEVYYILRGHACLIIAPEIGSAERNEYEVGPETVIYIPAGTYHQLDNTNGAEDLVLLTIWNGIPVPGANKIHDARIKAWGTTLRLIAPE